MKKPYYRRGVFSFSDEKSSGSPRNGKGKQATQHTLPFSGILYRIAEKIVHEKRRPLRDIKRSSGITNNMIKAIREEYEAGGITVKALAAKHGITYWQAFRIASFQMRERWTR